MNTFMIIEVEDGLTVVEYPPNQKPENVAIRMGGRLVDAGPYATYDEAWDAVDALAWEEDRDRV